MIGEYKCLGDKFIKSKYVSKGSLGEVFIHSKRYLAKYQPFVSLSSLGGKIMGKIDLLADTAKSIDEANEVIQHYSEFNYSQSLPTKSGGEAHTVDLSDFGKLYMPRREVLKLLNAISIKHQMDIQKLKNEVWIHYFVWSSKLPHGL